MVYALQVFHEGLGESHLLLDTELDLNLNQVETSSASVLFKEAISTKYDVCEKFD